MAEETTQVVTDQAEPQDFAAMALKSMMPDTPTPPATKEKPLEKTTDAPVKKEAPQSKIPDIFETAAPVKKDEGAKKDESAKSEFDSIAKPDFKNPKASEQWDQVRAKGLEFEKKYSESAKTIADLQAKIAELEGKTKAGEELGTKYSDMEKRYNEAMGLVQKVNIELDPEFRRTYVDGRKSLIDQARTIVAESGGNPDDVQTALNLDGKARADALGLVAENMNGFQQGRLGRVIDALSSLDKDAASKRSSPEEYLKGREEFSRQQALKQEEEYRRNYALAFDDALSKSKQSNELLRVVESMPEWNKQGEDIIAAARDRWNNNRDMTSAAQIHIDAAAMPVYRKLFLDQRAEAKQVQTELAEAKAELEAIYKNRPGVRASASSSSTKGREMDFAERTVGMMNGSLPVNSQ